MKQRGACETKLLKGENGAILLKTWTFAKNRKKRIKNFKDTKIFLITWLLFKRNFTLETLWYMQIRINDLSVPAKPSNQRMASLLSLTLLPHLVHFPNYLPRNSGISSPSLACLRCWELNTGAHVAKHTWSFHYISSPSLHNFP